MASSPRILCRPAPTGARRLCKKSGVKALRNTSPAKRQAAKLCYRFGPLTPSARSANLIAGDGTKNGLSAPNKEPGTNQNDYFTGKAPYKSCKPSVPQIPLELRRLSPISLWLRSGVRTRSHKCRPDGIWLPDRLHLGTCLCLVHAQHVAAIAIEERSDPSVRDAMHVNRDIL